jgi:hypothetical protein
VIVNDPSRSNFFGRAYSKSFSRKVVLKVRILPQAMDKANAAGGVWANPKWAVAAYCTLYSVLYILYAVRGSIAPF